MALLILVFMFGCPSHSKVLEDTPKENTTGPVVIPDIPKELEDTRVVVGPKQNDAECWNTANHYKYAQREVVIRQNPLGNIKVTLDLQGDRAEDSFDAGELADIANLVVAAWERKSDEKVAEVAVGLSNFHIIVPESNEEFRRLLNLTEGNQNLYAKVNSTNLVCFEVPPGSKFTVIFKPYYFQKNDTGVDFVVHELVHMVSLVLSNHGDRKHEDRRLWTTLNNRSVQSIAIRMYGERLQSADN